MKIKIKNKKIYEKIIVSSIALGIVLTNIPTYSLASESDNKYYNEISQIKTKKDLQKSAQKAVKNGEIDTWITQKQIHGKLKLICLLLEAV